MTTVLDAQPLPADTETSKRPETKVLVGGWTGKCAAFILWSILHWCLHDQVIDPAVSALILALLTSGIQDVAAYLAPHTARTAAELQALADRVPGAGSFEDRLLQAFARIALVAPQAVPGEVTAAADLTPLLAQVETDRDAARAEAEELRGKLTSIYSAIGVAPQPAEVSVASALPPASSTGVVSG